MLSQNEPLVVLMFRVNGYVKIVCKARWCFFLLLAVKIILSHMNLPLTWSIFSPCIECQQGLTMRKVSIRLSNVCIVKKCKKDLSRFLYHTEDHLA